jgi:hypothetical protein
MFRLLAVLAIALVLSGCGSAGGGKPASLPGDIPRHSTCNALVGRPVADALDSAGKKVTCLDASTVEAPQELGSSGCYPGGKYDKSTPMRWFPADDGTYFGRTGGSLHFKAGVPSTSVMAKAVGC